MKVRKDRKLFDIIEGEIDRLQPRLKYPFFNDQSLLMKSIVSLHSSDQFQIYQEWQSERRRFYYRAAIELTVAEAENHAPLTSEQRNKVVQLIADLGPPSQKRGHLFISYVMYQMSVVPDDTWLAICDKHQFDVFNKLRQNGRESIGMLRRNGMVK